MQFLEVPPRILRLLNQWQEHFRWVTFAGDVHPTPLLGAKGIPQGNPSSAIAMYLVLMLAKRTLRYLGACNLAPDAQTLQRVGCLECLVWHILGPKIFTINSSSWHGIRLSTRTWWMLSSIWCFFRIKNSAEVLERNPTCQTCGPNFGTFTGFPLPSKVQNYVGSSPAAAWGHMCNSRFLSQRQRTELLAKFSNAVHGTEIVGVPSSQLKQALVLGHCSDLLFYMTQKLVTALHGWKTCHALQLFGRSPVLGAVWRALMTLQCEDIRPGVFSFSHGVWNCPCPLGFLPKLQHNFSSTLARYAFQSPFLPLLILDLWLTCLRFA